MTILYTAKEAANALGMTTRNVTQYWCKVRGVGHKRGLQWFLTEQDLHYIYNNMRGGNARNEAEGSEGHP